MCLVSQCRTAPLPALVSPRGSRGWLRLRPAGGRWSVALCPPRAVRASPSLSTSKAPPLAACVPGAPETSRHRSLAPAAAAAAAG